MALAVKNLPARRETEETQFRPLGWEDSPGEGHGNPLQCSCLGNPMDMGSQRVRHDRRDSTHTAKERHSVIRDSLT